MVFLEARLPYKEPALLFEQAFGPIWTQASANQRPRHSPVRHGRAFVDCGECLLVAGAAPRDAHAGMEHTRAALKKAFASWIVQPHTQVHQKNLAAISDDGELGLMQLMASGRTHTDLSTLPPYLRVPA